MTNTPTIYAPAALIALACDADFSHTIHGKTARKNITITLKEKETND